MSKELRNRINQWNKIKYKNDNSKRVIICTLKPEIKKGAVTTASNSIK